MVCFYTCIGRQWDYDRKIPVRIWTSLAFTYAFVMWILCATGVGILATTTPTVAGVLCTGFGGFFGLMSIFDVVHAIAELRGFTQEITETQETSNNV